MLKIELTRFEVEDIITVSGETTPPTTGGSENQGGTTGGGTTGGGTTVTHTGWCNDDCPGGYTDWWGVWHDFCDCPHHDN